jgi:hypothetical protein
MARRVRWILQAFCSLALTSTGTGMVGNLAEQAAASDNVLQKASSWNWPENAAIIVRLNTFLDSLPPGKEASDAKLKSSELSAIRGIGLLEGIIRLAAEGDASIRKLSDLLLTADVSAEIMPDIESALSSVLANGGIPDWLKSDCQLWVSRCLVQNALYDEALNKLQSLSMETVSDPSTYLFNLAVCQHHLLRRDECIQSLGKLLEREIDLPTRYAITARLMEADIKPLKEDSLDEISRLMNDVERRLTLGRTGKMVRDKQQAIIDKLDKSIDQIEQQMQQQQQQQKQKKQQNQKQNQDQSKPQDQVPTEEVKGPGEIDPKDIGNSASWGNLPPAQRQEALQNMTKDLPSHYREVIEAYFKRLSTTNK